MLARRLVPWILAVVLWTGALPARAASFDPQLTWRSLQTQHFRITFHQGEEKLADELSLMCEDVYSKLTGELRWAPSRRIEVLLVDRTDSANGYATSTPYPAIVMYVTAPEEDSTLSLYSNWTRTILTHELTHVLHLDTNYGIVRLARAVFGRVASTNELSPRWVIEGLAVYEETKYTDGGRGRTPLAQMILRTAVLDHAFPPLGNMDGFQPNPPAGNLRYLFGDSFIHYVAEHDGSDVWTRWSHLYGRHIPYVLLPSKKAFGKQLVPLYFQWKAAEISDVAAQLAPVRAEGLRQGKIVSKPDASCNAPSYSPDGTHLVWACYDLRTGAAIWIAGPDGSDAHILMQDYGAKTFTWRRDSKAFVFAATHIVNQFDTWSDIYLLNIDDKQKKPTALTAGKRARDPDFSPDGSKLVVVTNKVQDNQLQVMTVDRLLVPLTHVTDHTQFSTPRWSPDGKVLAVSVWKDGQRDLWLYSPDGRPLRRLTMDRAVERDPRWSADGRYLFYASDRTGIYDIYALDTTTEHLWQVTNVETGAVSPSPSPDGKQLAYQQYSEDGWEVRLMPLDPKQWLDRGLLPRPLHFRTPVAQLTQPVKAPPPPAPTADLWRGERTGPARPAPSPSPFPSQAPSESIDTFEQVHVKDVFGPEKSYPFHFPVKRYNPLPMLVPRFWVPYVQLTPYGTPSLGTSLGLEMTAATGSSDIAGHLGWSASLSYRTDANFVGGTFGVVVNRWLPVFSAAFVRQAVPYTMFLEDPFKVDPSGLPVLTVSKVPYWEARNQAILTLSYPYQPHASFFAQYTFTARDNLDPIPPAAWRLRIPVRGTVGKLSAGWRYAWAQPTPYAISTEDGRVVSLVASLVGPWLGTRVLDVYDQPRSLTQVQLTGEWNEYVVNPWVPNHVLAWRLAGGAVLGDTQYLGNYQLGGNIGDSPYYVTPDEFRMLRGHPFGADAGDYYWLGSVEYRFPLWRVERGVGTIPAYLQDFSGVVFVDTGNAVTKVSKPADLFQNPLTGVGAELRFAAVVGWNLGLTGRLGYAVGFGPYGYAWNDPRTVYFRLGGSF